MTLLSTWFAMWTYVVRLGMFFYYMCLNLEIHLCLNLEIQEINFKLFVNKSLHYVFEDCRFTCILRGQHGRPCTRGMTPTTK